MARKGLFDLPKQEVTSVDEKYSKKTAIPQYVPSDTKPVIEELIDSDKYRELCQNINKSKLPEEEKQFLRLAASRHIVFNYAKIADYYAHSDKEMQKLMEQSALVIIDMNDAIANGYVRLSKNIEAIMKESGRKAGEK